MSYLKLLSVLAIPFLLGSALAESAPGDVIAEMSSDQVLRLEQRLSALGYLNGEVDSAYDAETRSALESFQQANGLESTSAHL